MLCNSVMLMCNGLCIGGERRIIGVFVVGNVE
jgi:hypothetical protein